MGKPAKSQSNVQLVIDRHSVVDRYEVNGTLVADRDGGPYEFTPDEAHGLLAVMYGGRPVFALAAGGDQ